MCDKETEAQPNYGKANTMSRPTLINQVEQLKWELENKLEQVNKVLATLTPEMERNIEIMETLKSLGLIRKVY